MCVDYTDLNKHCPKDPFGLPRIDQVVDSTAGCSVLFFLDCYSGYHQISLAKEDEEKTTFITPFGAFCYTSMPFGLKHAGATYQRAIQTSLAAEGLVVYNCALQIHIFIIKIDLYSFMSSLTPCCQS